MSKVVAFFKKQPALLSLIFSLAFSVVLDVSRVISSGHISYIFLVWNLFLGFFPFLLSFWLVQFAMGVPKFLRILIFLVCIAFLPNAPYMITDLFHLRSHEGSMLWFDTLLIASFAWNGLILFFHTLDNIDVLVLNSLGKWTAWLTKFALTFVCSFGIYIGRYLRFNSWDVLTNPFSLFNEIAVRMLHPFHYASVWAMTFMYSIFLVIAYLTFTHFPARKSIDRQPSKAGFQ